MSLRFLDFSGDAPYTTAKPGNHEWPFADVYEFTSFGKDTYQQEVAMRDRWDAIETAMLQLFMLVAGEV